MAGHTLLQVLLVAVVFGSKGSQAQNNNFYFPGNPPNDPHNPVTFHDGRPALRRPATVDRFVPQLQPVRTMDQPVNVRTMDQPTCAQSNQDDPCIADVDYNDNIRTRINRLLDQQPSVNELVSDPMLRVILDDPRPPPQTRFGGARETPVCAAQEELIFPQRAKTSKNDWVFVLNQERVQQALRVEKCNSEGIACDFGVASNRDTTTTCRQKYVYRRMLTLGNNNIEPEEVLMPSCCVCYFTRESLDVAIRIGNSSNNEPEMASVTEPAVTTGQTAPLHSLNFAGNGNTGNVVIRNYPPNNQRAPQGAPQGGRTSSLHRRQGTTTFITHPNTHRNQGNPFMRYH